MARKTFDKIGNFSKFIIKPKALSIEEIKNKRIVSNVIETTLLTLPLVLNLLNNGFSDKEKRTVFKVAKNPIAIALTLIEAVNKSLMEAEQMISV